MADIYFCNFKYITLAVFLTIASLASVWYVPDLIFGSLVFVLWLGFFGYAAGTFFLPKETRGWQTLFGMLAVFCFVIVLLSSVYWFYELNRVAITVAVCFVPTVIAILPNQKNFLTWTKNPFDLTPAIKKTQLGVDLLAVIALLGNLILFGVLLSRRFTDTLLSPWSAVGTRFFIVFFLTSLMLLWVAQQTKKTSHLFPIVTHALLMLSLLLIIYKHGFGFDPFIHLSAEQHILNYGVITPKQPYYIGQYMLTLFTHLFTHVPLPNIDKALVPIGSAILLPFIAFFAFTKTSYEKKLLPAILLLPLIPLVFFTVTTPNNLATLMAALTVFWMWYESKHANKKTHALGLLFTGATCAIHAFIGIPLLVVYLGFLIATHLPVTKIRAVVFSVLYFALLSLALPMTFFINAKRSGQAFALQNPVYFLDHFWALFQRPFWFRFDKADAFWHVLYRYYDAIRPLVVATILVGFFIAWKKYHERHAWFFLVSSAGIVMTAFLVGTAIDFENVITYEQAIYADRLLELATIVALPFFIIAIRELFLRLEKSRPAQMAASMVFAALLLVSWYFTYPTRDPVSYYTGYNVRDADIEAVHFIDERNAGDKNYVVITNQAVSAAALKEFGFAKYFQTKEGEQYFYSIPTGGPLAQFFNKMVYQEPKKEWMIEAMDFAGVDTAYFIHTNYWAPAAEIRDKAKLEADAWWELGQGRVWVYEYTRP